MRKLSIAYGSSCHAKRWVNQQVTFDELCERLSQTVRTPETVEEYCCYPFFLTHNYHGCLSQN